MLCIKCEGENKVLCLMLMLFRCHIQRVIPDLNGQFIIIPFFFLLAEVVRVEPFYKPVPKPRSKAPLQLDETQKDTVVEVSQERHRTPSNDSRFDSLSSSTLENLECESEERSPDETHSNYTPPASTDNSEDGNFNSKPFGGVALVPPQ